MKAIDETWKASAGGTVLDERGKLVCDVLGKSGAQRYDRAAVIAAAPAAIRALLALAPERDGSTSGARHTSACWLTPAREACLPECVTAISALRDAGALP